jgi:hypothetical protein
MNNDIVEQIVDWVVADQDRAVDRFGGYHYGNDFVVRDHVAERLSLSDKKVEVFRAPYDLCDHDDVLIRVRRKYAIDSLRSVLENRTEQLMKFAVVNSRS